MLYRTLATEQRSDLAASALLGSNNISGIRYLDGSSRMKTGGEVLGATQNADGQWISSIRKQGVSNWSNPSPSDYVTTKSMPFGTEQEAMDWANSQISQGTSNYVAFDDANLNILSRNGQPLSNTVRAVRASDRAADGSQTSQQILGGQPLPDRRFDGRVNEQERISNTTRHIDQSPLDAPKTSIEDLEGRQFILGMSDRTDAGGNLTGIDDVMFDNEVPLQGGQDYMFRNPGQVWAAESGPAAALHNRAAKIKAATGENPLFIPYRMAPTGGDFSTMTGEAMIAYASKNMGYNARRSLDKTLRDIIPGWKGIQDPLSVNAYRAANGNQRKLALNKLDSFRDKGGLSIGQARLSVADPRQIDAIDFQTMNIGEINPDMPLVRGSGHNTYNTGIPGEGIGHLLEGFSAPRLTPDFMRSRGVIDPDNLPPEEMYAMRRNVLSGTITEDIIRDVLESRKMTP